MTACWPLLVDRCVGEKKNQKKIIHNVKYKKLHRNAVAIYINKLCILPYIYKNQ